MTPVRGSVDDDERMLPTEPVDPWTRWSWLMGAIWLVFLVFPVEALVVSPDSLTVRAAGLAAVGIFAGVYVSGLVARKAQGSWWNWGVLTLMVLLSAFVIAAVGSDGLGMLIYVMSFSMLAMGVRTAVAVFVAVAAAMMAVSASRGDLGQTWFLVIILTLVAAALLIVRVLDHRGESFRALRDEVALVAERERVARDVHDVLGHSLTVVTAKAELAERLVDLDPARAKQELAEIRSLTRESLSEIRATVSGLRIARLGEELESARTALHAAGIVAHVEDGAATVDPRYRLTMAWVLREAVTNVVRHSGASSCDVRLATASLCVLDDGVGRGGATQGNGLLGIGERVRVAGGQVRVSDNPAGSGTLVEVSW